MLSLKSYHSKVQVQVWDYDMLKSDDFLGRCAIDLNNEKLKFR